MTVAAISALDLFYAGASVAAVAAGVVAVLLRRAQPPAAGSPPASWGGHPSDQRWEDEAVDQQHTGLQEIRDAANGWGQTIGALLGVFSIVAFVKGPEAFTDVKGTQAEAAALLVLLAGLLAAVAILLAALAAQGAPASVAHLDGWELRVRTGQRARTAAAQLTWSRLLAVAAALAVLLAVGLTWLAALAERDSDTGQKAIVITGGEIRCGQIKTVDGTLALMLHGKPQPLTDVEHLTLVDSCP